MTLLARLVRDPVRGECVTHVQRLPARAGAPAPWPEWVAPVLRSRLELAGVVQPWAHQARAADLAWAGRSVVVATGTASGKSLAYQLPVLTAAVAGDATALYLAPTKALAADQLRAVRGLHLTQVRATTVDGDSPPAERDWARRHANVVLTNPDLLHHSLLPAHQRWSSFLRRLRFVVVDECHVYRGVFGSHVAQVLRRLQRVAAHHGAQPTVILASATAGDPAGGAARLLGREVAEVSEDAAPKAALEFALWEPPLGALTGENGAPVRRSATAEAATLLADLVVAGVRTVAFVRSRRAAEVVAMSARRMLDEAAPELAGRVAAYRGGYLPEERRQLEHALQEGRLLGLATTNALELGVDVSGLDAVVIAGWPGTRSSLWQQAGRAGRSGREALAVLVARDDPLDTYVVHHPDSVFGRPVEASVTDPDNPYVLEPHLCAAAAELPLTPEDLAQFGPAAPAVVDDLVRRGLLRRRPAGWYWTRRERASDLADLRGTGGVPVRIVEEGTGRLLGTVDAAAAHTTVHDGAVYVHQGRSHLVRRLDLQDSVALVVPANPDWTTTARELTDIAVVETSRLVAAPRDPEGVAVAFGTVDVTSQVVSFQRRRPWSGELLGEEPLDLPPRQLRTKAVWWTVAPHRLRDVGEVTSDLPGAAHAAEHAAIGLLPLFATCDRWDIGGVSTALHPDTGRLTVFVYDGARGGAGFAERGFAAVGDWLEATRLAVAACDCAAGCPSCVQSPKCGNGNEPLHKAGAVALLAAVTGALGVGAPDRRRAGRSRT